MEIIQGVLKESYDLFNAMSPYLLFGFFVAGILHVFLSPEFIARHLGKNNLLSVIKAAFLGIPLPLCSCGVLPAAMSLKKEGASRGAILSFLISTPTTGVDSILATYSLMGGFFALYRVIASFLAGIFSGIVATLLHVDEPVKDEPPTEAKCKMCGSHEEHMHSRTFKMKSVVTYAFGELLSDIGKWLLVGVVIGGVIAYVIPDNFFETYIGTGFNAMVIMLIVGIPMYVCATGSIPIAAALMLKGMNPGAAFVFLIAGPATNAVGMAVVLKNMGKRTFVIYIVSIIVVALGLGMLLDFFWGYLDIAQSGISHFHREIMPLWLEQISSAILLGLIIWNFLVTRLKKRS